MTAPAPTAKASGANGAQEIGLLSKWLGKAFAHFTPSERAEFMADAALRVGSDIGKAGDMLADAPGRDDIGHIEDQWSGAPDDHAETQRTGGPGTSARPGRVPVARPEAASGDGAAAMEDRYSRFAPQGGVQSATERLGREVAGMRGAMKSLVSALAATQQQIDLLIAAKAEDEEKKDEKEEKEAAKAKAAAEEAEKKERDEKDASKAASETEKEMEEEGEKETTKAEAIAAAQLRIQAKSALRDAEAAIVKAEEMEEEERKKAAEKARARGNESVAKAESLLVAAKALRPIEGPSTVALTDGIAKAKKALGAAQADNQDNWPASTERAVGKGAPSAAEADFARVLGEVQKAASGLSLLNTNMQGLMEALAGQSRGGNTGLPPAFNLAKAAAGDITMRETAVMDLAQKGVITHDDMERARDVLGKMRANVSQEMILPFVNRLPPAVQTVVLGNAA